ncbi:hypothetical protein GHT06_020360 [Daphnia sinensis]|uniref:Uncharacterized protein n=1 Tax=Daphnia sinensis TaxID=1820382 RepID=A0AAD5PTX4_9CRUS|nr:hypothetical protein GHT06_020360 [Daphnia sinensis]
MDPFAFTLQLKHRGNFGDTLEVVGAFMISLPFHFFTRFRPEDKEIFVEILLFSLLYNPCAPPSGHDFGFRRARVTNYYYQ